jgi:hypothetical protein
MWIEGGIGPGSAVDEEWLNVVEECDERSQILQCCYGVRGRD